MEYWAKPGLDRLQAFLFYPTLDGSISQDHPVRALEQILRWIRSTVTFDTINASTQFVEGLVSAYEGGQMEHFFDSLAIYPIYSDHY